MEVANRMLYWKPLAVIMSTQLLIHCKSFSCTKAYVKHRINEFLQNPASTPIIKAEGKTSKKPVTPDRSKYWKQHKIIASSISRLILGHIKINSGRDKTQRVCTSGTKESNNSWSQTKRLQVTGKQKDEIQRGTRTYLAQSFINVWNTSYDYSFHGTEGAAVEYSK